MLLWIRLWVEEQPKRFSMGRHIGIDSNNMNNNVNENDDNDENVISLYL